MNFVKTNPLLFLLDFYHAHQEKNQSYKRLLDKNNLFIRAVKNKNFSQISNLIFSISKLNNSNKIYIPYLHDIVEEKLTNVIEEYLNSPYFDLFNKKEKKQISEHLFEFSIEYKNYEIQKIALSKIIGHLKLSQNLILKAMEMNLHQLIAENLNSEHIKRTDIEHAQENALFSNLKRKNYDFLNLHPELFKFKTNTMEITPNYTLIIMELMNHKEDWQDACNFLINQKNINLDLSSFTKLVFLMSNENYFELKQIINKNELKQLLEKNIPNNFDNTSLKKNKI